MDHSRLEALLAVARATSPNAAAHEAGVAATTLYRQVEALEKEAGSALFQRRRGAWTPTPLGIRLIAIAAELERRMLDFRLEAASANADSGVLRVTSSEAFSVFYLAGRLAGFAAVEPGICVELNSTNRRLDLSKGEADVAVRPHSQPGDGLVGRRVGRVVHAVYASRAYVAAHGLPDPSSGLQQHRLLAYGDELGHFDVAKLAASLMQGARPVARFNDITSMARAVESGMGVAVLPSYVGRALRATRRIPLPGNGSPADIWLLCHAAHRRNARVTAFIRYFAALIKQEADHFA